MLSIVKIKTFWYLLKILWLSLYNESAEIWIALKFLGRFFYSNLFERRWTFFRCLKIYIGCCVGWIPAMYFFYFTLLFLWFFLRLFFAATEIFFTHYWLLSIDKSDLESLALYKKRYAFFLKIKSFCVDRASILQWPAEWRRRKDFYFSRDFVNGVVEDFGNFLANIIVFILENIDDIVEAHYTLFCRWGRKLKRVCRKYYYYLPYLFRYFTSTRTRIILYYDIRRAISIFRWIFFPFIIPWYILRGQLFFLRLRGSWAVFFVEHYHIFYYTKAYFIFFFEIVWAIIKLIWKLFIIVFKLILTWYICYLCIYV